MRERKEVTLGFLVRLMMHSGKTRNYRTRDKFGRSGSGWRYKCGFRPVEFVQLMRLVSGCLTGWAQRKDQIKEREE